MRCRLVCSGGGVRVGVCAVNCQDYPDLCERYEVTTYPSVLLHRGEGQWEVHYGVLGAQQILESLEDRQVMRHQGCFSAACLPTLSMPHPHQPGSFCGRGDALFLARAAAEGEAPGHPAAAS